MIFCYAHFNIGDLVVIFSLAFSIWYNTIIISATSGSFFCSPSVLCTLFSFHHHKVHSTFNTKHHHSILSLPRQLPFKHQLTLPLDQHQTLPHSHHYHHHHRSRNTTPTSTTTTHSTPFSGSIQHHSRSTSITADH